MWALNIFVPLPINTIASPQLLSKHVTGEAFITLITLLFTHVQIRNKDSKKYMEDKRSKTLDLKRIMSITNKPQRSI